MEFRRVLFRSRVYITGRLKEIIVMSTGEKIPPADIESAILRDALFDQVMLIGEGRAYLTAMVVVNDAQWREFSAQHGLGDDPSNAQAQKSIVARIAAQMKALFFRPAFRHIPCCIKCGIVVKKSDPEGRQRV